MFNLGRLAAALLNGGRGGRSAEARVVRAVTQVVTGTAPPARRTGTSAEATRRRKEAESLGLPAPRSRSRATSVDRAAASGAAVLAETIADRMTRGSVPTTAPPRAPAGRRATAGTSPAGVPAPNAPAPRAGRPAPNRAQDRRASAPPASPQPPSEGLLLVRAMVAAAKADGRLDPAERKLILERLDIAGLTPAERDIVLGDFDRPATAEALARGVRDAMLAARVYAAAAAAAGERCDAEQAFLAALAKALRLDAPAIAAIERQLAG